MVNITHQHGIHLYLVKAGGEGGVNAVHHTVELVRPVMAWNWRASRLSTLTLIAVRPASRQRSTSRAAVTVGSDRNLTDRRVFTHGGNDLGEVAAQGGFPTGEANFFGAQRGESARNPAYFVYAEKAIVIDGAGLVTVRQA